MKMCTQDLYSIQRQTTSLNIALFHHQRNMYVKNKYPELNTKYSEATFQNIYNILMDKNCTARFHINSHEFFLKDLYLLNSFSFIFFVVDWLIDLCLYVPNLFL